MSDKPASRLLSSSPLDPTAPVFEISTNRMIFDEKRQKVVRQEGVGWLYILAFDVESTGPVYELHSMVSIGAKVVRMMDNAIMSRFRNTISIEEGHGYSKQCESEFWDNWVDYPNNKVLKPRIEKEGIDPKKAIQDFANWVDEQEAYWPNLAFASDNPEFDAGWISHYFWKYLKRNPFRFSFGDESQFRSFINPDQLARGMAWDDGRPGRNISNELRMIGVDVPSAEMHDHDPENDAEHTALLETARLQHIYKRKLTQIGNQYMNEIPLISNEVCSLAYYNTFDIGCVTQALDIVAHQPPPTVTDLFQRRTTVKDVEDRILYEAERCETWHIKEEEEQQQQQQEQQEEKYDVLEI